MNEQNYASLDASKRLIDAGIVLDTEAMWIQALDGSGAILVHCSTDLMRAVALDRDGSIPAPSMAEVWNELPEIYNGKYIHLEKDDGWTFVSYEVNNDPNVVKRSANPTDALIDLLIWARREKETPEYIVTNGGGAGIAMKESQMCNIQPEREENMQEVYDDETKTMVDTARLEQLEAREQVMLDLHEALGVKFGEDPYAAINKLKYDVRYWEGAAKIENLLEREVRYGTKNNLETTTD